MSNKLKSGNKWYVVYLWGKWRVRQYPSKPQGALGEGVLSKAFANAATKGANAPQTPIEAAPLNYESGKSFFRRIVDKTINK